MRIATSYPDENGSVHFRPLVDAARIYVPLLASALSSLIGFTVDAVVLFALASLTGRLVLSALLARAVSGGVNSTVSRRWGFSGGLVRVPASTGRLVR